MKSLTRSTLLCARHRRLPWLTASPRPPATCPRTAAGARPTQATPSPEWPVPDGVVPAREEFVLRRTSQDPRVKLLATTGRARCRQIISVLSCARLWCGDGHTALASQHPCSLLLRLPCRGRNCVILATLARTWRASLFRFLVNSKRVICGNCVVQLSSRVIFHQLLFRSPLALYVMCQALVHPIQAEKRVICIK